MCAKLGQRVIALLDMDCFYCQVEHKRLKIPTDQPLGVLQWNYLVASNYAARADGVKRGDSLNDALAKCPSINIVHVETIQSNEKDTNDEALEKISLQRYRNASSEILSIISANCKSVERASIDEAYLDLTEEVEFALAHIDPKQPKEETNSTGNDVSSHIVRHEEMNAPSIKLRFPELYDEDLLNIIGKTFDGKVLRPEEASREDLALLIGSLCVYRIRRLIFEKLSYTVSAGIAWNKLLSKLASSMFKPNKQVIVLPPNKEPLLEKCQIRSLRGLGGKLGKAVKECFPEVETAMDLQKIEMDKLHRYFDEGTCIFLWKLCRGVDDEPIAPNLIAKSMCASKQFSGIHQKALIEKWLYVMAEELQHRLLEDIEKLFRKPRTLGISHSYLSGGKRVRQSRSAPFPSGSLKNGLVTVRELYADAHQLLLKLPSHTLTPCVQLSIGAYDFEAFSKNEITNYFKRISAINWGSSSSLNRKRCYDAASSVEISEDEKSNPSISSAVQSLDSQDDKVSIDEIEKVEAVTEVEEKYSPCPSVSETRGGTCSPHDAPCAPDIGNASRGSTVECMHCGNVMNTDELQVHLDYHAAIRLFQEYNPRSNLPRSDHTPGAEGKNQKPGRAALAKKKRKIPSKVKKKEANTLDKFLK